MALTVYMASQTLVLNYSRKLHHIEPLWFASIANNILWWTFVKACTRTVYAGIGAPHHCLHQISSQSVAVN